MTHEQEQELVGEYADCINEFNPKNPRASLEFLSLFLEFCRTHKFDPQDAAQLSVEFMGQCQRHEVSPAKALEILDAQDWGEENSEVYLSARIPLHLH